MYNSPPHYINMYIIVLYDQSNHICPYFSDLIVYKACITTGVIIYSLMFHFTKRGCIIILLNFCWNFVWCIGCIYQSTTPSTKNLTPPIDTCVTNNIYEEFLSRRRPPPPHNHRITNISPIMHHIQNSNANRVFYDSVHSGQYDESDQTRRKGHHP